MLTNQQLWQAILADLELSLSKANFTTWFKNTALTDYHDGRVVISVPNTFTQTWFERKYHNYILKALERITKERVQAITYKVEVIRNDQHTQANASMPVKVTVSDSGATERVAAATHANSDSNLGSADNGGGVSEKYIFDNFIVGKNNELAYAAAKAVIDKPGQVYNPLFIYGGVGLGKTHLLQAIGNALRVQNPRIKILYVSSERFTNEYIQSVKFGRGKAFKDLYRNVDLLLIDDVQFIAGKEGTQEEFFHTFNALHQTNKQIVLTSDRPPKAIPQLEQRLLSRFEWGMIADISSPNLETRIAILEAKCKEKGLELAQDIIQYLATNIQNNVRELEGALNRIIAHHQLSNTELSLVSIKHLLSTLQANSRRGSLTPKQVVHIVSEYYDVTNDEVTGKSRKKNLVNPRQIIMYLLRQELSCSFPSIGDELGGRDHTTAIHAFTKVSRELEANQKLREDMAVIRERLYSSS